VIPETGNEKSKKVGVGGTIHQGSAGEGRTGCKLKKSGQAQEKGGGKAQKKLRTRKEGDDEKQVGISCLKRKKGAKSL